MNTEWPPVSKREPCEKCDKSDWCRRSADGSLLICQRYNDGTASIRQDRNGSEYYLYRKTDCHQKRSLTTETSRPPPNQPSSSLSHSVYSRLLDLLDLSTKHRENLSRHRGFPELEIEWRKYKSLPINGRDELARELIFSFGVDVAKTIPGFKRKHTATHEFWTIGGYAGLLIPVRNLEGRIVALRIRADDEMAPRYSWLSTGNSGGVGSGCHVHIPLQRLKDPSMIRITEGELKADFATLTTETLTLSVPGVSSWRLALPILEELRPTQVSLAFDQDFYTNPIVAKSLKALWHELKTKKFNVEVESWT